MRKGDAITYKRNKETYKYNGAICFFVSKHFIFFGPHDMTWGREGRCAFQI